MQFDSATRVRAGLGVILFFKKLADWKVTEMCLPFSRLNSAWNATEIQLSRHHSVAIQPPFRHHSVDWNVRFHPVYVKDNCVYIPIEWSVYFEGSIFFIIRNA